MKTIEEKAKSYDEALKVLHKYDGANIMFTQDLKEEMFPELKESEDERIRRVIRGWIYTRPASFFDNGISKEEMLAWLEKQGEQTPNKIEPKVKIGDWVVTEVGNIVQIKAVNNSYCTIDNGMDFNMSYVDRYWHKWTIKDAKPGDVLVHNDCTFIFMGIEDGIVQAIEENMLELISFGEPDKDNDYQPAAKEQRDLLFKKMREAGFEWNDTKRELKKIEQKPAWSEEDETRFSNLIFLVKHSGENEATKNGFIDFINRLKSLKDTTKMFSLNDIDEIIEKISEQMSDYKVDPKDYNSIDPHFFKPTDKAEPKFHNGEWIVWQDKCYKVNYNGCGYEVVDKDGLSTSLEYGTIDENAHLWDITKDAKDGDVLSDGTTIFIFKDLLSDGSVNSYCDYDTNSGESDAFCPLSMNLMCSKITPATKEQRDTLFAKMKDAGWEFDFDKKELKKIEQEPAETLVDWCVEDEKMLKVAIESCNKCGNGYAYPWLKSLKDRVQPQSTWKPSQKQMEALNEAIYHVDDVVATPLAKLIGDLKKLKE